MVVTSFFIFIRADEHGCNLHFYLTYLRVYVILIALVANAFLADFSHHSRNFLANFREVARKGLF